VELTMEIDYADEARVRRWLEHEDYMLVDSGHGTVVKLVIRLPSAEVDLASDALRNLTHGRARLSAASAC
jgi:putative IMPACT (imprinted ancient) family translation regulator